MLIGVKPGAIAGDGDGPPTAKGETPIRPAIAFCNRVSGFGARVGLGARVGALEGGELRDGDGCASRFGGAEPIRGRGTLGSGNSGGTGGPGGNGGDVIG